MDRFLIDADGPDDQTVRDAVAWLISYTREHGHAEAAIIVPSVPDIRNLAGAEVSKTRQSAADGVTVHFWTPRTQPRGTFGGPLVVPWANTKTALDAERLEPPAICVTGWTRGGLDEWKRAYGPTDLRSGQPVARDEAPRLVVAVVESLSGAPSDDVVHPMDRRRAVDAFRALKLCGERIDPAVVRSLSLSRGWSPDAADRLQKIAAGIADGRPVKGGTATFSKTKAKELLRRIEEHAG